MESHHPRPRPRSISVALLVTSIGFAASTAAVDIPQPQPGLYAPTALALLDYNHDLCAGIAETEITFWRSLSGDTEYQEERVRKRVTEVSLSDLAAGRAAADIIRDLLPRARSETDVETGASLRRLFDLDRELCDTVALPIGPREAFEEQVADILARVEREKEELGRLLVVPDADLAEMLEPYLKPIQLAGFEAEAEYLEYLEAQKPKPRGPSHRDYMRGWHQKYAVAVQPTKVALRDYFTARQKNDFKTMAKACRTISSEVIPLLKQRELFLIPMPQLPASKGYKYVEFEALLEAYKELRAMASDCSSGRSRETLEHLNAMQGKLAESAQFLQKFELAP